MNRKGGTFIVVAKRHINFAFFALHFALLPLALFMLGIRTNNINLPESFNDLAFFTNRFYGCSYFH